MRWSVSIALAATACGRLGFEERKDAGADGAVAYCAQATSVTAGREHSCLVDPTGVVWCWGDNVDGQVDPRRAELFVLEPTPVPLAQPAVTVEAGRDFSCAILADRTVTCWGNNTSGQLGESATFGMTRQGPSAINIPTSELTLGGASACLIQQADGSVHCWGDSQYGENGTSAATASVGAFSNTIGTKQVAFGHRHACMITAGNDVSCWGRNGDKQLGDNNGDRRLPMLVAGAAKAMRVASGGRTTCTVTLTGTIECWGQNDSGQRGMAPTGGTAAPVAVPGITGAVDVQLSTTGTCARFVDGTSRCWGQIDAGDGTGNHDFAPHPGLTGMTAESVSFFHACALVDGNALCWGSNHSGELGRGTRALTTLPVPVDLGTLSATFFAVGKQRACAGSGGELRCWGDNEGLLGDGTFDTRRSPTVIAHGLGTLAGVAVGQGSTCAWSTTALKCWGRNYYGEVGTGVLSFYELSPVTVTVGGPIQQVVLGKTHGCALVAGTVACWGRNLNGVLGDGTTTIRRAPVSTVPALSGVVAIASTEHHVCAVDNVNVLRCWGRNGEAQLGDGTTTDRLGPMVISVAGGAPVVGVAAGRTHTCAVITSGALYCWGANDYGELGVGDLFPRTVPTLVLASGVSSVVAGARTTCALMTDGSTRCWGNGEVGQRADGTTTEVLMVPVPVAALSGIDALGLFSAGGCARRGGALECWGPDVLRGDGDYSAEVPQAPHIPCQ